MAEQRSSGVGVSNLKKRGRPSSEGHEDVRARILDEARKLFIVYGFEATPISTIASHAGVAPNTVYHYFATKEVLWRALYEEAKALIWGGLREASVSEGPLVTGLLQASEASIALRDKYPYRSQFLYRAASDSVFNPLLADIQTDRLRNQEQFFEAFARRGLASGELAKLGTLNNATRTLQLVVMGFFFESHGVYADALQLRKEMLGAIEHLVTLLGE